MSASKQLTPEEHALWSRYFRCTALLAIADEHNAKTWPIDRATDIDYAQYIGIFCYVFDVLRVRQKKQL